MAKRNLVIYGWGNAGKTTIFNALYDRLKIIDPNLFIYREREQLGKKEDNDFNIIISYKSKSIVLYSAGDYLSSIEEALLLGENYDILVCACHISFYETCKAKFHRSLKKPHYTPKYKEEKNEKLLKEIIEILEDLINEI